MGVAVGLGLMNPNLEYYRAIADGEGEAMLMKARRDATRQNNSLFKE